MFDIMPTFATLAGGKIPTDRKIDGANMWPHLIDAPVGQPTHETFFYYSGLKLEAVRYRDWKLKISVKNPSNKDDVDRTLPSKLYNLKTDIGESTDVAEQNPEVVSQLQRLIESMKEDLGIDGPAPGSRALGRVDNAAYLIDFDK